jgi:G3E family GTPase
MTKQSVQMILVGGFLGAGKTTLLWQAANRLAARGRRVGLITNDQAPDLVDTRFLSQQGMPVQEVSGSCFCCNFAGLIRAAEKLQHDVNADVLIAEPVGSCTDLSATILQPLKDKFRQQFVLAPLSVLIDPERLREVLSGTPGRLHDSAAYIVRKQMEEADVLVLNKSDLLAPNEMQELNRLLAEHFPGTEVRNLSALTGEGVDEWLDAVLEGRTPGRKVVEVDYDTYAEGEAVLGWLNAAIRLEAKDATHWEAFSREFMEMLQQSFDERSAEVGHVKILLSCECGRVVANLTQTDGQVTINRQGDTQTRQAELIVNARVQMSPQKLEQIVREHLQTVAARHRVTVDVSHLQSLSPGRPNPTHRYGAVVDTQ